MNCPRRGERSQADQDFWLPDDTCSYCGSLNPDALMARLEAGDVELGPTDKNYKVYVENVGGKQFQMNHTRKCPDVMKCDMRTCEHWTVEFRSHTKFYFPHLSAEQQKRFIELHNERKMKIGYPGHFYVPPFFASRTTTFPEGE